MVTVSQIVAFNVRRARRARNLTQQALGDRLRQVTGQAWPRTAVNMAERAWDDDPTRLRKFDVNQLAALAYVLEVPIAWFFMPPSHPPGADADETEGAEGEWIVFGSDGERVFSSEGLRWMALARFDAQDPAGLMARRLRDEAPAFASLEAVENLVFERGGDAS